MPASYVTFEEKLIQLDWDTSSSKLHVDAPMTSILRRYVLAGLVTYHDGRLTYSGIDSLDPTKFLGRSHY